MFVASRNNTFIAASSAEPGRAAELIEPLSEPVFEEPGTFGFLTQPSIFGRGVGGARAVDLDIRGPELIALLDVATRAAARIGEVLPRAAGHQLRPRPGLELGNPEIRLYPDSVRLADAGVSAGELAQTVDTLNDGMRIAEVTVDGQRIDLMLSGPRDGAGRATQSIGSLPVVTPSGLILPAEALADVVITAGPTEVRHAERQRTVTLQVRPASTMPLEAVIEVLERDVVAPLVAEGVPPGVAFEMSGTADKLTQTWEAMRFDLFLALVIVYLVMAILFESFIYPLVIMVTVPVASAGGVAGLAVLNLFTYQALDMLTLLGFVILIGIVVNNAILLVEQTLFHLRQEGLSVEDAILEATRNRIRPIFMTTLTSVVGMLPLVVFPGAGSELYRGLGSVVVGGLMLSAALTLLMVPPLLGLCLGAVRRLAPSIEPAVAEDPVKPIAAE
jgi:HAE1 family hydrophobic/amphiphilic exporter-1